MAAIIWINFSDWMVNTRQIPQRAICLESRKNYTNGMTINNLYFWKYWIW